jgi:hypothetical protein
VDHKKITSTNSEKHFSDSLRADTFQVYDSWQSLLINAVVRTNTERIFEETDDGGGVGQV